MVKLKSKRTLATAICIVLFACVLHKPVSITPKQMVLQNIDSFSTYIKDTLLYAVTSKKPVAILQAQLAEARVRYKKTEWAAEYYVPFAVRYVNGPPLPEIEQPEVVVLEPHGLQVMEELLYGDFDSSVYSEMNKECKVLLSYTTTIRDNIEVAGFTEEQLFHALKLEIFRVIALGITGFDAPLSQTSIEESRVAVASVKHVADQLPYKIPGALDIAFKKAIDYLDNANDFNAFNRSEFIRGYANPLTRGFTQWQKNCKVPFIRVKGLLKPDAATLFDEKAYDVNGYLNDSAYFVTQARIALGEKLFSDPVLSINGKRACSGCHNPSLAFSDGLVKNVSLVNNGRSLLRNTPTLYNAAFQPFLFYDLRARSLEEQAKAVIGNKDEMHGDLEKAAVALNKDTLYKRLYREAYGDGAITGSYLLNALGSYVRSLAGLNSNFDDYMQGDDKAMGQEAIEGFNLFAGKAKCATCHFIPLLNGTVPPVFSKIESEVLGVPSSPNGKQIDSDKGRILITNAAPYLHSFKTVTVRNAALTAPYMHNGVYRTLEEVIDFYNNGGGAGMRIDMQNQTLPGDSLHLTKEEKNRLIAFINTLNNKQTGYK